LKKYYHCDSSSLLKKTLWDLCEELKDREIVYKFENRGKVSKANFVKIEDII